MRSARTLWLVVPALVLGLACAQVGQRISGMTRPLTGTRLTEAELTDGLGRWAASFAALVTGASDTIRAESKQRETRRNTLLWQLRMVPLARRAAFLPDAQQAYVTSLALATAQHDYLSAGEGRALFGPQQPVAVDAALRLQNDALELGRAFLTERELARLQGEVDDLVARHPIRGVFAAEALTSGLSQTASGSTFGWIVDLPMVPFRAISGVSDTAQAVNHFNETARAFTESVNELPHQTRWELELLLYDTEELESVERALAAAESFADGAERISSAAETLPAELGAEVEAQLLAARETIAELEAALARAENVSGALVHVSDRVGDASAQWTTLLGELRREDAGAGESRPFDVREYGSAADQIGGAGRELRGLVEAVNGLDESRARSLLDAATWRGAALLLVFFAGLIAYRVVALRLRR